MGGPRAGRVEHPPRPYPHDAADRDIWWIVGQVAVLSDRRLTKKQRKKLKRGPKAPLGFQPPRTPTQQ